MKNHIKQMLRTPLQSALIIILIMIVTVMLVVGGNLWVISDRLSKAYEDDFITIGTVTQKPDTVQESKVWDAEKGDYLIYKNSVYNRYAMEEDLEFPETAYLAGPERRVYWGSYVPEYVHTNETINIAARGDFILIAEFSPKEDCVPDESVNVLITRVLGSNKAMEGSVVWFCDHLNRYPEELKADKTYVAEFTAMSWTHGERWETSDRAVYGRLLEYCPQAVMPTLYTPEGERMESPFDMQGIYEVTEGFYETEAGQRFLAAADMSEVLYETQPVVGTNNTNLIMPFYEGSAWVYEGRYPTKEEYAEGSAVCLAPRSFAENNGLSVGDSVTTRLYYTNAGRGAHRNFYADGGMSIGFWILGLDGRILEPFEEQAYTIVGLYDYKPGTEGIGADELIVPFHSVHNKMESIVDYGAMTDDNTSFQIENGTIADYLEISAKHGTDNLIFTFYDRGYSALTEGIQNLKNMSAAFLIMGLIAAVILTLQISHIYITKQKKRLSIERLMGMTGKQCRNISLAGILLLLLLGTVPGVAAGTVLAGEIGIEDMEQEKKEDAEQVEQEAAGWGNAEGIAWTDAELEDEESAAQTDLGAEEFNRKYSNLGLAVETDIDLSGQLQGDIAVSCAMGVLVLVLGMGFSGVRVRNILKGEPLYLVEDNIAGR